MAGFFILNFLVLGGTLKMAREKIDVDQLLAKRVAYNKQALSKLKDAKEESKNIFNQYFFLDKGREHGADSVFYDPYFVSSNCFENIRTISRIQYGGIHCRTLRAVAAKAWIINCCITHISRKIKPFLKPVTSRNERGFIIHKRFEQQLNKKEDKEAVKIRDFICATGNYVDPSRDDFVKYCVKLLRDELTLDQVATEIQYNKKGEAVAFFAVDAATIERVIPEKENETVFKYLQIVDGMPSAGYTQDNMIFDFENPRTDIYHSMYGYSLVEQAVDLITSEINTFIYNAGNFTENKLPKGMLLLNSDANSDVIDEMEDYIAEIMSGGPLNQWRIPIIPSGDKDAKLEWKAINTNREMEFQAWLDYLSSGVMALFGCSADELGIQSQKSQAMFENGGQDRMAAAKSSLLGDLLVFFESYINKIVAKINPEYVLEFVGYEKDNPNTVADLDEKEVRTWKSVNEKRAEKGLDPIDLTKIENPADLPMNVQLVQLFQSQQAQDDMGGDMDGMGGFGDEEGGEENGEEMEEQLPSEMDEMLPEEMNKSINKSMLII
jgi:hypothetical protein